MDIVEEAKTWNGAVRVVFPGLAKHKKVTPAKLEAAFRALKEARAKLENETHVNRGAFLGALDPVAERIILDGGSLISYLPEWACASKFQILDASFILGAPTMGGTGETSGGGMYRRSERSLLVTKGMPTRSRLSRDIPFHAYTYPPMRSATWASRVEHWANLCWSYGSGASALRGACVLLSFQIHESSSSDGWTDVRAVDAKGVVLGALKYRRVTVKGAYTTTLGICTGIPVFPQKLSALEVVLVKKCATCSSRNGNLLLRSAPVGGTHNSKASNLVDACEHQSRVELLLHCHCFEVARKRRINAVCTHASSLPGGTKSIAPHASFLALGPKYQRCFHFSDGDDKSPLYSSVFVDASLLLCTDLPDFGMMRPTPTEAQNLELTVLAVLNQENCRGCFAPVEKVTR
jgi:hypothetical protein